jgi:cobyrinic acid a,c-diamide synthase
MIVSRLVIAGTQSGVGKTTVTLAILAALNARGRQVQPFKAGPDFIDPGHHSAATGRSSRNLDGWMLGETVNRDIFSRAAAEADISIIEGMMGLFDGSFPVNEIGSTAELAKQLDAPVLLVIDGSAMARSAAAMVSGYAKFDPALRVVGVLFNRVSSEGHYKLLKEAVEQETDVAVVGYLRPDPAVTITERHLGLAMTMEQGSGLYDRLAKAAEGTIDLDRVEKLARLAGDFPPLCKGRLGGVDSSTSPSPSLQRRGKASVCVGVAYDQAFCFYYPDNLELLEAEGAELVRFSPMKDQALPEVDMLYLGGGYPELHGKVLAGNVTMRTAIRKFAELGGTIYAECGGMMYLTQCIRDFDGTSHEMVGLFPAEAVMRKPGLTLGYRTLELSQDCILGASSTTVRGHEFHYSTLVPKGRLNYACALRDAREESIGFDGLVAGNVLALYTHLHFASQPQIAQSLVSSVRRTSARLSVTLEG